MSDTVQMTAAARDDLVAEIAEMEGEARRQVAERIKAARELGDLKENAEYHQAKEDAALLELKIERRREQLRSAEIVEVASGSAGAGIGSKVSYRDETTGREATHTLVAEVEARPSEGLISIASPVGKSLAGAEAGDQRTLETPKGERSLTILAVEHSAQ